jgi:tetratricopeptide (TPR) repeat protein
MTRFQGFPDPDGLLLLDTATGEVLLVARTGERRLLHPAREAVGAPVAPAALPPPAAPAPAAAPAPPAALAPLAAPLASTALDASPPSLRSSELASQARLAGADDLDREVILTFPYPIARPYLDLLEERDPRLRCKLLVDTFTAVLKVWALVVASEYLRATEVRDAQVHKTLVRDLARPLISAWNLLLQRALVVLRDAKVPPFAPELGRAYEALETKCKQRFLVTETYLDDAGRPQTRTKKLGKIQALIAYRNGLAHGFNQNAKQAQRDLDTYLPLLKEVLREARFLARYPLWQVQEGRRGPDEALGFRWMGATAPARPEPVDAAELDPKVSPLFLKNEASGDVLPLFAFFDVSEVEGGTLPGLGRDVFLFEGNTKGTVIYVSATGEHAEKAARFAHWQALLAAKAVDVELLSADTLTLDALRAASRRVSDLALEALVASGKYLREASVDRADLKEHLAAFEYGRFGAFVLGGESGIGKSTLLARLVEQRRDAGDAVVFYRASALPSADVSGRLLRDLGLTGMYFEDFLAAAAPLFRDGVRCWLVVDAVNEFGGDVAELVRQLDHVVQQSAGHDWFRLVASVRDSAYQRLPADARFGARGLGRYLTVEQDRGAEKVRTPVVALAPLGKDHVEALYEAYRAYRQRDPDDPESPGVHRFRPSTAFAELAPEGSTRALLRSPLLARLVLEAHHRRALPSDLRSDRAMRLYLDQVVVEVGSPSGSFPERRGLLGALVREFDRASTDTLPRDALAQVAALRAALLNPQRDSAYVQLVELGVLLEEWDGDTCYVRFAFDRLFEFLLAELHDPKVQTPGEALALTRRAVSFRSLRGALEAILGRACEQGREALLTELLDLGSGDDDEAVRRLVAETGVALLVRLARETDVAFERIVRSMPAQPSKEDVEVLCDVADKLALLGEVAGQELAVGALVAEAEALDDGPVTARAKLRQGDMLRRQGDLAKALDAFDRAKRAAEAGASMPLAVAAQVRSAEVREAQGALEEARTSFAEALERLRALGDLREAAAALRHHASIARRLGDVEGAERSTREALALAREMGDRAEEVQCLNLLADQVNTKGDVAAATALFEEALGIARGEGHLGNVALVLSSLGLVSQSRDTRRSEACFTEALELRRKTGDKSGEAAVLAHLGRLASARGDKTTAEGLLRESLALRERIGEPGGVAGALSALALLCREQGQVDEAEGLYARALELRRTLGDLAAIAASYNGLGNLASTKGDIEMAERYYRDALAIDESLGDKASMAMRLNNLAIVVGKRGLVEEKEAFYERARVLNEELGKNDSLALTLNNLAAMRRQRGDLGGADDYIRRALALREGLGLRTGIASSLESLGHILLDKGDEAAAVASYERSLAVYTELRDAAGMASATAALASVAARAGDLDRADELAQRSKELDERRKSPTGVAGSMQQQARFARYRGDGARSLALAEEAAALVASLGDAGAIASSHESRGLALRFVGRTEEAVSELRACLALRASTKVGRAIADATLELCDARLDLPATQAVDLAVDLAAVDAVLDAYPVPALVARRASVRVRLAALADDAALVGARLRELDDALAAWRITPMGFSAPQGPLLDAALAFERWGGRDEARQLATRAKEEVRGGAFHRASELDELVARLQA